MNQNINIFASQIKINHRTLDDKVILAPKNSNVIFTNNYIIAIIEGETVKYLNINITKETT